MYCPAVPIGLNPAGMLTCDKNITHADPLSRYIIFVSVAKNNLPVCPNAGMFAKTSEYNAGVDF